MCFIKLVSRYIKDIEEDDRLADLLKILREKDVGDSYSDNQNQEQILADNLDSVKFNFFSFFLFVSRFIFIKLNIE
jgi:hypothetical protein